MLRSNRSTAVAMTCALLLSAPVVAQNLAVNADFDDDVASWTLGDGTDLFWTSSDVHACGGSGSAVVTSQEVVPGFHVLRAIQCLDMPVTGKLSLTMFRDTTAGPSIFLSFHTTSGCSDDAPTVVSAALGATTGWEAGELLDVDVPAGTQSVRFGIQALNVVFFGVSFDRVYLGSSPPIFLDGFEGDFPDETMPCRWSASTP